MKKLNKFIDLCTEVSACRICARMCDSQRVLGPEAGNVNASVMFIGEAPGRLGADETGIPFHGDQSGSNFEKLLGAVGIDRSQIFVTNAVLCNPRDEQGNNATPTRAEMASCSSFLTKQLALVNPEIVVTLGGVALEAIKEIDNHVLTLKESVGRIHKWNNRQLIPVYHPGQRAMVHRSYLNQQSDYRTISDAMRRLGVVPPKVYGRVNRTVIDLVEHILSVKRRISYFALHKIVYLVEYSVFEKFGARYTTAYFIRQKEGPYCTDLHIKKLLNTFKKLRVTKEDQKLILYDRQLELLPEATNLQKSNRPVDKHAIDTVNELIELEDSKLKTKSYHTKPMKRILRRERNLSKGEYNAPLDFDQ